MLNKLGINLFSKPEHNNSVVSYKNSAFTLAEVVLVMLIIAVVASVSIKIAKSKLDKITSYTYYNAYNTVKSVSTEMLKDFDTNKPEYGVALNENTLLAKIKYFVTNGIGISSTFASSLINKDSGTAEKDKGTMCLKKFQPDGTFTYYIADCNKSCTADGYIYDTPMGDCPDKYYRTKKDETPSCTCVPETDPDIKIPTIPDPEPVNPVEPVFPDEPGSSCPEVIPCGKECNAETGYELRDIAGFSRTCNIDEVWNETPRCACIPTPQTLARNGEGFCKLFVSYTNTTPSLISGGKECAGDSIANDLTEFSDKKPDIVLRNGMRLYNVSQDPIQIPVLNGNSKGNKYNQTYTKEDGTQATREIDIDEVGYTIYIDIDGKNGDGVLWDDVYRFYVTLSGLVIPAFDEDNPGTVGGDSRFHLQTSVSSEIILNNKRQTNWITKSKSFKESACTMGYVNAATPYCNGITANAGCVADQQDCRLKIVMPIKFFGP